jgi:hypothetical protein
MGDINSRLTRLPREAWTRFPRAVLMRFPGGAVKDRLSKQTLFRWALAAGATCGLVSLVRYHEKGYSDGMLLLWLAGLAGLSVFLWSKSVALPRIARLDVLASAGLAVVFAPLYLISLYEKPVQVSSDEVAIIGVSQHFTEATGVDPFGPSYYLGRPTMLFLAWGRLGELLGGLDLYHMRLLHALVGLLTIAACYALFRQLLPRGWAMFATAIVGVSHSMLMISRLAMRENTAVLIEVVALAMLLWGLRNNHLFVTFWGAVIAGLGFYVYFPARAIFPIWLAFLVVVAVLLRRSFSLRRLAVVGAAGLAGFVLMAGPIVIAESRWDAPPEAQPQKDSLMIFKLGRDKQWQWMGTPTFRDAYEINVKWGLTAFNNKIRDHGFIYDNLGHGFVDPLTGILLWFGVGLIAFQLVRRRAGEGPLLAVVGFLILWLSFAFVVNKAPNYTRLLVTLPFVAYFVAEAVRWISGKWRSVRYAQVALISAALLGVVVWNLSIARDYVRTGERNGDTIGSTGRYVAAHKDTAGMHFYIAVSDASPYYSWGGLSPSIDRMVLFAKEPGQVTPVDPTQLLHFQAPPPFALLMTRDAWQAAAPQLAERYPRGRIRNVMPTGTHVALEARD